MSNSIRTHQRRTPEQWQHLIAEQQQSGLSQQAFCRDKGLVLATFGNWKRRLGTSHSKATQESPAWLELPTPPAPSPDPTWDIELDLGNGICLRLRQS